MTVKIDVVKVAISGPSIATFPATITIPPAIGDPGR